MSQHDFSIANQTASSARSDINNGLQALASNNSGASAPSTTYANMFWYDTTNNILKVRDETNSTWINVIYINQASSVTSILEDTNLVTTGGSTTGLLGDQLTSAWNTGTGTTESLVSPAKIKSAIDSLTPDSLGVNQTWQDVSGSRAQGTSYQNSTGVPIMVAVSSSYGGNTWFNFEVSTNNSSWIILNSNFTSDSTGIAEFSTVIPDDTYYRYRRLSGGGNITKWVELR